tara:strand:- start:153 stop:551 length:399 start_codon:yes stop_codon:yes gene_type:complete
MRMKSLITAIFLILVALPASAQVSGNTLLENCSHENGTAQYSFCVGFIVGVADSLSAVPGLACVPEGVTNGQILAVTVKFLEDNPSQLHLRAAMLQMAAVSAAFPCADPSKLSDEELLDLLDIDPKPKGLGF